MNPGEETQTGGPVESTRTKVEEAKEALRAVMSDYRSKAEQAWAEGTERPGTLAAAEEPVVEAAGKISRALVFGSIAIVGAGLMSVVLVTGADWFYPAVFFGLVTYFAWQRYL